MAEPAHQHVVGSEPARHIRRLSEAVRNHHLSAREVAERLAAERATAAQNEPQTAIVTNGEPGGSG